MFTREIKVIEFETDPSFESGLDGHELLSDHGQHLDVNSVELVKTRPCSRTVQNKMMTSRQSRKDQNVQVIIDEYT